MGSVGMITGPTSPTFMPEKAIQAVLAARLKTVRKALGLSQVAVGLRMGLPDETSSARVNRWEKAVHPTSLESAEQLAEALGVPLPFLVCRDDKLAEIIMGYALLPKARQDEILSQVQRSLGAEQAEVVKERLGKTTPKAKRTKDPGEGRL